MFVEQTQKLFLAFLSKYFFLPSDTFHLPNYFNKNSNLFKWEKLQIQFFPRHLFDKNNSWDQKSIPTRIC